MHGANMKSDVTVFVIKFPNLKSSVRESLPKKYVFNTPINTHVKGAHNRVNKSVTITLHMHIEK